MKKQKMLLALSLVLTTTLSVFADGETTTGNLTLLDQILRALGLK
jgi:hypothetical protein